MAVSMNGTALQNITFNGTALGRVIINGTEVFRTCAKGASFTYTGTCEVCNDNDAIVTKYTQDSDTGQVLTGITTNAATYTGGSTNWRIKFKSSGTFVPLIDGMKVDIFIVGGGGGGGNGSSRGGSGGGGAGGYTTTVKGVTLTKGTSYKVTVGAGGEANTAGGKSVFGSYSASGGGKGNNTRGITYTASDGSIMQTAGQEQKGGALGQSAGTGAGGYGGGWVRAADGDMEGGDGVRAFGSGSIYYGAGGGGGGHSYHVNADSGCLAGLGGNTGGGVGGSYTEAAPNYNVKPVAGIANTGGGGGGGCQKNSSSYYTGAAGGSGIVIIRNAR